MRELIIPWSLSLSDCPCELAFSGCGVDEFGDTDALRVEYSDASRSEKSFKEVRSPVILSAAASAGDIGNKDAMVSGDGYSNLLTASLRIVLSSTSPLAAFRKMLDSLLSV